MARSCKKNRLDASSNSKQCKILSGKKFVTKFLTRSVLIFAIGIALQACGTTTDYNFSVPDVQESQYKIPAEVRSITVSVGHPNEAVGVIPMETQLVTPFWRTALEEALDKTAIFQDDAEHKVSINVTILKIDAPAMGFTMVTDVAARYEIRSRRNGNLLYRRDINSEGVVPLDYAFVGYIRAKESINRAVQKNIAEFINEIKQNDQIEKIKQILPANSS